MEGTRSEHILDTGHPRMGGEHIVLAGRAAYHHGSSPHGRGTLPRSPGRAGPFRVIPAWAGNIPPAQGAIGDGAGHPRMGGEHSPTGNHASPAAGSSPHGRGTCLACQHGMLVRRVIPAWAGNIPGETPSTWRRSGHPRMGGEHSADADTPTPTTGSSPHGRGTYRSQSWRCCRRRVIPAWAGNMSFWPPRPGWGPGHPRMGGEHNRRSRPKRKIHGSSPHGRGTYYYYGYPFWEFRVIPAWAGNMRGHAPGRLRDAGHPRMGGEHARLSFSERTMIGSSPHGRGTFGCEIQI